FGGDIDSVKIMNDPEYISKMLAEMESQNKPLSIDLPELGTSYIYYEDSYLLTQLKFYPYIQFFIIGLFLLISYILFSIARKSEQNQVWVGLAKETAHQLGTPISSMIAWIELLKLKGIDDETIGNINEDITRLETITERFSKIGSAPKLEKQNVVKVIYDTIAYVKSRTSIKVDYRINLNEDAVIEAWLNDSLFKWVIENLCKNAIDAMDGKGTITIEIVDDNALVNIDITDSGKGIPKSKHKTIFHPGYTSKKRGWGLGLSLSKRIIENYHDGKVFVKSSVSNKGTTMRIILKK
ncbi:sensor histidine kinase, partial [candidate division KSB1 bacterium]